MVGAVCNGNAAGAPCLHVAEVYAGVEVGEGATIHSDVYTVGSFSHKDSKASCGGLRCIGNLKVYPVDSQFGVGRNPIGSAESGSNRNRVQNGVFLPLNGDLFSGGDLDGGGQNHVREQGHRERRAFTYGVQRLLNRCVFCLSDLCYLSIDDGYTMGYIFMQSDLVFIDRNRAAVRRIANIDPRGIRGVVVVFGSNVGQYIVLDGNVAAFQVNPGILGPIYLIASDSGLANAIEVHTVFEIGELAIGYRKVGARISAANYPSASRESGCVLRTDEFTRRDGDFRGFRSISGDVNSSFILLSFVQPGQGYVLDGYPCGGDDKHSLVITIAIRGNLIKGARDGVTIAVDGNGFA